MQQNIIMHPGFEEMVDDCVNNALKKIFGDTACIIDISEKPLFRGNKIIVFARIRHVQGQGQSKLFDAMLYKSIPLEVVIQVSEEGNLSVYEVAICTLHVDELKSVIEAPLSQVSSQPELTLYDKQYYIQFGDIKIAKTGYYEPK